MVRFMYVVLKGNPLDCPFAPKKKNDPVTLGALLPSIISGGAGVLSNLFGGLFGSSSQSSANAANLEMTKMNNDTQKQLAREVNAMSQQQFNENMKWLREQYYDTQQMKRAVQSYKAAGLNPALAYGAPNAVGSVGAPSQSQFHVAQTEAGHVEPYMPDFDGLSESVGHSVDAYLNNKLIDAQTENINQESLQKRIQNFTQFARDVADLRSKYADIDLKLSQKGLSEAERDKILAEKEEIDGKIKLFWKQFDDLAEQPKKTNVMIDAQAFDYFASAALKRAQTAYQNVLTEWYPSLSQSQIEVNSAQIGDLIQSAALKIKEGQLTDAKKVGEFLRNGIDAIDYKHQRKREKTHNSNKATRVFYGVLDEIGYTLFNNLKLFAK